MIPGEMIVADGNITINEGRKTKLIKVINTDDRPIQVGSHYHFFETNKYLKFDRKEAFGFHLDIASGQAVRFEPGEEMEIQLVEVSGGKRIFGLNNLTEGYLDQDTKEKAFRVAKEQGFMKE